jgi:serine/threonine protein kinase
MPFVKAGTLADLLHGEPLPIKQVRSIMTQVGDALDCAHSHGVVHRDVKPSNVLVDERGNCMLTDFGIGKILTGTTQLTRTGDIIGTPAYMSPEQGLGQELDGRSDVYSLGVMLYKMITGRQPYRAETPMAIIIKHINDPLPPPRAVNPAIPESVERVVLKALVKDRDLRFSTAGEMISALDDAVMFEGPQEVIPTMDASPGIEVSQPTVRQPIPGSTAAGRPRLGRLPWVLGGIGVLGVIGVIMILGFLAFSNRIWGNSPVDEIPVTTSAITPEPVITQTKGAIAQSTATNTASPVITYDLHPNKAVYVFDNEGLSLISSAIQWKDDPGLIDVNQAEILVDPKGEFERVARLSVRGYGHGDQTAWVTVRLEVPDMADIVLIPVATSLNGAVEETDSESGLEILMRDTGSDQESWTYASYLYETQLGVPYVYAFADASQFRGKQADLMIRLRQIDVCAGSHCTHDADFYLGDLYFGSMPDICTKNSTGELWLYDYYDDPTPHKVSACEKPLLYYFLDIEDGPYNDYGGGESEYKIPFALPENAELMEFRLYYGYYTSGIMLNNHSFTPEEVYGAFPLRIGVYHNIPEPARYSFFNNNPNFLAPFFDWGQNEFSIGLYTENPWEERPFDVFMRFKVPVP